MADMGWNELQVMGNATVLRRFREQADERFAPLAERDPYNGYNPKLLSFHRLLPIPADVAARDYGDPNGGYEWQKLHWGVKWGASSASLNEGPDGLIYFFETACYPPLAFLQTISTDYPTLMFTLDFTQPISHSQEQFGFQNGRAIDVDE
jgi:hypothetical protein